MSNDSEQTEVDRKNAAFWDELCGSQLADTLGITDDSPESLKKFDDWYFDFYPYLYDHIPFSKFQNKDVMEVGLGYGTVSQKIMEAGANYHGLDIAAGPVGMARHRADQLGVDSDIRQGSVLEKSFGPESLDWVIAIGCLHHTGNIANAIKQVHTMLRPGGEAMIMVYSASSYRQLFSAPVDTLKRKFLTDPTKYNQGNSQEKMRSAYDKGGEGDAAPQTEFVTKKELRHLCRDFGHCEIISENIGNESPFMSMSRATALKYFGGWLGLDLYCHVVK